MGHARRAFPHSMFDVMNPFFSSEDIERFCCRCALVQMCVFICVIFIESMCKGMSKISHTHTHAKHFIRNH